MRFMYTKPIYVKSFWTTKRCKVCDTNKLAMNSRMVQFHTAFPCDSQI